MKGCIFAGADPRQLGHKLLAVNLSDLAAMGAEPVAVTLALTIPKIDASWLSEFSQGMAQLAKQFSVDLIGRYQLRSVDLNPSGHGAGTPGSGVKTIGR